MSRYRGLTSSFLEAIAEVVEVISYDRETLIAPHVGLIVALVLTSVISFSRGFLAPIIYIASSILLAFYLNVKLNMWIKPVLFTLFVTSVASLPLLFIVSNDASPFSIKVTFDGVLIFLNIVLRAVAAASIFTVITIHLGWWGIIIGLRRLHFPSSLIFLVAVFIKYIPILLRDAVKMMAAREARTMSHNLKLVWRNFSSVIGDLLLRAFHRSWRLQLAFRARGFGEEVFQNFFNEEFSVKSFGFKDLFLILFAVLLVVIGLVEVW